MTQAILQMVMFRRIGPTCFNVLENMQLEHVHTQATISGHGTATNQRS